MKDLTGKGKPFHSSLDKAAALLKRKVGTGAEFMQELKGLGGIKQAEIDERKLGEVMGMPRMTHDQFMANLAIRPVPAIKEKVLGNPTDKEIEDKARELAYEKFMDDWRYGEDSGLSRKEAEADAKDYAEGHGGSREYLEKAADAFASSNQQPRHGQYTLPGGGNYREMLIKAPKEPNEDQFYGPRAHFGGENNILASMRLKDRTGPNGEKLLHLEELQSDWHQQGREKGYRSLPDTSGWTVKSIDEDDPNKVGVYNQYGNEIWSGTNRAGTDRQIIENVANNLQTEKVPDAPFKKNWEEMALKRLIHHAAESGYHGIVVTPGKEQADRYSLAKHIDDLHYSGTNLVAYDPEGNEVIKQTGVRPQDLPDLVGKELADKLMAQEPKGTLRSLRGVDLEVGGEGMKGFYDKKVPNILNSIGKKYGVKIDKIQVPVKHELQGLRTMGGYKEDPPLDLHHFPITEDMRKDILTNGLPLYNEGGVVHKAKGGAVNAFDYENPEHTQGVAHHLSNHADFKKAVAPDMDIKKILNEMLSKGEHRFVEDPRTQAAIHKAGHSHYYVREKTGKVKYPIQHVVKKAFGGSVNEMKAEMMGRKPVSLNDLTTIGANEAPDMNVKAYVPPSNQEQLPVGGVSTNQGALPIGGVDMNSEQQGHQIGLQGAAPQPPQGVQPTPPQGQPSPLSAGASSPSQQSNILQMTPQGQALNAMKPPQQPMPQMAMGGRISSLGGVINDEDEEVSPLEQAYRQQLTNDDDGNTNFSVDDTSYLADGGQPKAKKLSVAEQKQAIFQKAQEGLMKPSEALGRHEGKYMHITEADRAKVEKRKHGMRGGVGFSQIGFEDPEYEGMSWGVAKPGTGIKLLNRQKRGLTPDDQSIYTTFIGTPEMHTSNQLVFNRMYNKFMQARKAGLLSPEQEAQMLDILRSLMTKGTAKNPSKAIFDKDVSFENSSAFNTFDRRRAMSNLMAGVGVGGKKGQIFDASKMIEDTTDPRLLHAPTLSVGPHTFSLSGEMSNRPDLNKAFPIMLHGESHPEAFQQLPFKEAAPDFTQQIRKAKGRDPGYMDIVRGIPRQQLTEKFLTSLQKIGKKKGGKVSDNLDTMRLALTKKKAK
jgi:hypothetical protein